MPVAGTYGRIDPAALRETLAALDPAAAASRQAVRGQHHAGQRSRRGLPLDDIRAITEAAKAHGLKVHMDGARFANAVARLGISPAEMSWRAGVDIMSFGATKNGGALCDAIVVFNPELAEPWRWNLRRAGQVWSKMRFASAQLMAYIEDGLWLRLAQASNAAAARIAAGIEGLPGLRLIAPVEANEIFLELPGPVMDALEQDGFQFYRRGRTMARFVCRFDLTDAEADALVAALKRRCAADGEGRGVAQLSALPSASIRTGLSWSKSASGSAPLQTSILNILCLYA